MFYFFSKVFSVLTQPIGIFMFLLMLKLVFKSFRWFKYLHVFAFVFIYICSLGATVEWAARAWEVPSKDPGDLAKYDVGIVLTGGISSEYLSQNSKNILGPSADRIWQAAHLYKLGKIKYILISGGDGKLKSSLKHIYENDKAKEFLVEVGVPDSVIFQDKMSINTHENAVHSKDVFPQMAISKTPKILIITSAWHMKRAMACFKKQGIITNDFAANPLVTNMHIKWYDFLPDAQELAKTQLFFKEWIGYLAYWVVGYI